MTTWVSYSIIALCFWGLWGFCEKVASRSVIPGNLIILSTLGSLSIFPIYLTLFAREFKFSWQNPDYYMSLAGGMAGAVGGVFFYFAISKGEASRVVTLTSLYPMISVILASLFLNEALTLQKIAGIACAMAAMVLLTQ
ncbi:MAG: EamA family transporter [Desulfobacterales bacterium]|jgi:transporter family protein|nr:EamA family transporter [Desulfobacterales bacterium]